MGDRSATIRIRSNVLHKWQDCRARIVRFLVDAGYEAAAATVEIEFGSEAMNSSTERESESVGRIACRRCHREFVPRGYLQNICDECVDRAHWDDRAKQQQRLAKTEALLKRLAKAADEEHLKGAEFGLPSPCGACDGSGEQAEADGRWYPAPQMRGTTDSVRVCERCGGTGEDWGRR